MKFLAPTPHILALRDVFGEGNVRFIPETKPQPEGKKNGHSRGSHADDFNDTEPCLCEEEIARLKKDVPPTEQEKG